MATFVHPGNPHARWRSAVAAHDTLLFNLGNDPGERNNLAAAYPDTLDFVLAEMDAFVDTLGSVPPRKIVCGPADVTHYDYLERKNAAAE